MGVGHFTYSVAIRTLGTNVEVLKRELQSLVCQTVQPEKVIIYIAEKYERLIKPGLKEDGKFIRK